MWPMVLTLAAFGLFGLVFVWTSWKATRSRPRELPTHTQPAEASAPKEVIPVPGESA
jgi:hypothetical protein